MNLPIQTDNLANQITVKSAVNPSLWACVAISLPLFALSFYADGLFSIALFVVAIVPIGIFAYSYIYLLYKNPEYLRSEDYQLKMNQLRFIGDKDNPEIQVVEETALSENPKLSKPKIEQKQIT